MWADEDVARARLEGADPGAHVEIRLAPYALELGSEADAWAAFAAPLGLRASVRDPFADLVEVHAEDHAGVRIEERAALVVARRSG
jgi:hypothetical protein